jgi:C4-dicarboxylate-specific signal transduction histidine kinase
MTDNEGRLQALMATLLGVANASFDTRAPRTYEGDEWDVLAYLVNATADEVQNLLQDLETEREELRTAQDRLMQSEQLAALGRLSAGVAHEIYQPLTVISGLTDLIRLEPNKTIADVEEDLALIAEACRQLCVIADSIRSYGRTQHVATSATPALAAPEGAAQLLSTVLQDRGIALTWDVPSSLPDIEANVDQLRQVFINLLSNASDALATVEDPTITVSISATAGELVYRVRDNGPGVELENPSSIFEPFVTTKSSGAGTGLGLSIAQRIVMDHRGSIEYISLPDQGACFDVHIPRAAHARIHGR